MYRAQTHFDGSRSVDPITHQEMADLLGSTRPMISRVMKELERGGYFTLAERRVLLHKTLPARF